MWAVRLELPGEVEKKLFGLFAASLSQGPTMSTLSSHQRVETMLLNCATVTSGPQTRAGLSRLNGMWTTKMNRRPPYCRVRGSRCNRPRALTELQCSQ